ncbi:MAG: hypothetical protein LBF28_01540 [Rickettsiales bacterium]|jgi:hypothetical protein|nr:hypothetical protein [Rickettsiales bacterium]
MKKTLKAAVAASVLATPAMAANMENPLYLPAQGQLYSKTSAGIMYKKADGTDANNKKNHAGAIEFPIYRGQEDIGYGITDRLSVNGSFGYTHDGDIDRQGMHLGRLGLTYRAFDSYDDFIWDWYVDAHLGGVSKMTGKFDLSSALGGTGTGFSYDNYSNGRWGFYAGTRLGKTWGKFTGAVFAEVLQTFGNDNNEITVLSANSLFQGTLSINLKSTTEFNAGLKAFYEIDERWSLGGGFTYKHHADNGIKSISSISGGAGLPTLAPTLAATMANMNDGFDEYILSASVANRLTDSVQIALYGEYTFDTAHVNSQNGTDVKAEAGVRLNVAF